MKHLKSDFMPEGDIALISPDKRFAIFPVAYFRKMIENQEMEDSSLIIVNMIVEDQPLKNRKDYDVLLG